MCGDTEVALLGPGSFAGDLGLVDHRLRNARVVAVEPVRALTWSGSELAQLREELSASSAAAQVTRDMKQQLFDGRPQRVWGQPPMSR
jgi:CRP-like cAMP-binding protein